LPFSVPKSQLHCTRNDFYNSCKTVSPGSAFFGDFLSRWTKSYPPQAAQQRAEKFLEIKTGFLLPQE
jgi:hypothetical protein